MNKKEITKNYIYNLLYQIFSLITPFVTAPYVSRVLGVAGVGKYSFVYSISYYFVLAGSLGFPYYAQRETAALQNDKRKQTETFWEIIIARFISVGIATALYIALIYANLYEDYTTLLWLMGINILASAFDITFFFQGNDVFDIIAVRNLIIRCIGIVSIFVFVKDREDLEIYILCQVVVSLISSLSLWTKVPTLTEKVVWRNLRISRHFIPTIRLFIPTIAMSVYTMLDRTLIGVLVEGTVERVMADGTIQIQKIADVENGFYEQSEKIVKMAMTIFTSLSTVLISRNSADAASGNFESLKRNIYGAIRFLFFIGIPIMFGLAAVALNFTPWFFGDGYEKTPYLIMLFSPITMIIGISNVLGRQYLIPMKRDKDFTVAIFVGAIVNLILNLCLIKHWMSYGAAFASVVAELMVTFIMYKMTREQLNIWGPIKEAWKEILAGLLMFAIVLGTQAFLESSITNTLFLILEGAIVYFVLLIILKDDMLRTVIDKLYITLKGDKKW